MQPPEDIEPEAMTILRLVTPQDTPSGFEILPDDSYRMVVTDKGIILIAERIRREHHELIGELSVECRLPGARVVNGCVLSIADMNFSSARARQDRARLLAQRANTDKLDWLGIIEDFSQRIIKADRAGCPATDLRELAKPGPDDALRVRGFVFPRRHATVLFGDGGAAKSYVALWLAGLLVEEQNLSVGFFDWELAGEDHRDRLERLFPDGMPRILYVRCERPLTQEVDRLRRLTRDASLEYAVYDSVAFACDGPPEAAEVTAAYYRAARQIGIGGLHVAHISKAEGADRKPFGSAFWHNGARTTWYVKRDETLDPDEPLSLGFFNRKANLGPLQSPLGFRVQFTPDTTIFARTEVADMSGLSAQLSVRQRMLALLRHGGMKSEQIAEEIETDLNTVKRTSRRYKGLFVALPDGRIALGERKKS